MQNSLSRFENAILQKLLEGDLPFFVNLREQLVECIVNDREHTGVGFFTSLSVPDHLPRIRGLDVTFGDVVCEFPETRTEVGFLLYIKDGVLDMLEGYTYDEPWPSPDARYSLKYVGGEMRDLEALERTLRSQGVARLDIHDE